MNRKHGMTHRRYREATLERGLQSQAGLTELQRAQRSGQLAAPLPEDATTQHWRPVILDLDGDGVKTVPRSIADVAFDVDGSAFFKETAWAEKDDAFLVLDRNLNGLVDDGTELFSNARVADSAKGLAGLRWVDANGDGDITAYDPVFKELRVWQDRNGNGGVDDGEISSLAEIGISALHYGRGSYDRAGETKQMANPDLDADVAGTRMHAVEGGILVQTSDGHTSLIVTKTEDLSNIAPGKDRIAHGIEDVRLDLDVLVLPCLRRSDSLPSLHHAAAVSQELKGMRKELFGLASACPYGEPANAPAWRRSA